MEYLHGDRVRILGKPEWGPGFIQGHTKNGKVKVAFEQVGKKTLSLQHAKLMKVTLRDLDWIEERLRRHWRER
ncbi:DUF3553 domain-containing protein [Malonomonas rubra]|uniref:DUF3553 domain-containing protein n=1 Tax=Malonomonas rubra TaxID=57040 RepID=UPI0026EFAABD|nr:DUF3553 domain-containing protein [Malonomonas rubra]